MSEIKRWTVHSVAVSERLSIVYVDRPEACAGRLLGGCWKFDQAHSSERSHDDQ